jgi:hypothetical protein
VDESAGAFQLSAVPSPHQRFTSRVVVQKLPSDCRRFTVPHRRLPRVTDSSSNPESGEETDVTDDAVASFLSAVDRTLGEYDQGYMDADAALALVRDHVDDLRETVGAEDDAD